MAETEPLANEQLDLIKGKITLHEGFVWSRVGGNPSLEQILARTPAEIDLIRESERLGFLGYSFEDIKRMSPEELQLAGKRAIEKLWAD